MTSLKDTLQHDLTESLKAGDTTAVSTIRLALTSITREEVAGKSARELSDDDITAVLAGELKRRREAAAAFREAGRPERAEAEDAEAQVLARYLPAPLSRAEVQGLVDQALADAAAAGLSGGRAMGAVMKQLKPETSGRFDGAELAALVKQSLGL